MTIRNIGARSVLLLLVLTLGCEEPALEEVPTDLVGRWTTTEARYADRAFEITLETFYLGQGGDLFVSYAILRTRIIQRKNQPSVHSIEYRDQAGDETSFDFIVSEKDGTIYFTNQPQMVWRRDPGASVPWGD